MDPYTGADLGANGCIDENTAVRLMQGQLDGAERERAERHLDACGSCAQVFADLARLYSPAPVTSRLAHEATTLAPAESTGAERSRFGHTWERDDVPSGTLIGKYQVKGRLSQGGMGVLYVAHDVTLQRDVALKLLRPGLLSGEDRDQANQRMTREAQAMAQVRSPSVLTVFDAGTYEGRVYLAMELCEGMNLRQWLQAAPRSNAEILDAFRQAGTGLLAAHDAGLVHRDFKPDNVLVAPDGSVKVGDFGLTRFDSLVAAGGYRGSDQSVTAELTVPGSVLGTPAYMSPEQLFGRSADARSDQFSFATALWEALSGRRPFAADSLDELRWKLAQSKPELGPRPIPDDIAHVLQKALRTDPDERYPSMRALISALARPRLTGGRGHITANWVIQAMLFLVHAGVCVFFGFALASGDSPSAPATTSSGGSAPGGSSTADLFMWVFIALFVIALLSQMFWGPLGLLLTPINVYGLRKRRAWARYTSLIYALICLPTCLGTPYGVYALYSLTRKRVRQEFDEDADPGH